MIELKKYDTAERFVLKKIRERFGLGRTNRVGTGSAPTEKKIFEFLMSFGLCLVDAYGMSESCGLGSATANEPNMHKLGSAGKAYEGIQLKLDMGNSTYPGSGEICQKGRHVCMGYMNMDQETRETIDDEGWLHSGDIGHFDKDGFLFITGRIKELIITAGGENVAPVPIEEKIKKRLPFVSNALLVGDKRKHLSILFTLVCDFDEVGNPLEKLSDACIEDLRSIGSNAITVKDAIMEASNEDSALARAFNASLNVYNDAEAESNAQKVHKWKILPHDFSLVTGELNNTLKLKRDIIIKKYSEIIDEMYENSLKSNL